MTLAAVLAAALTASTPANPPATAATPPPCCFVHEAYAGTCAVVPAEKETCETILAYLNSPNSTGKTYCNSTRLRGQWKSTPCSAKEPSGAPLPGVGDAPSGEVGSAIGPRSPRPAIRRREVTAFGLR